jgi:SpoVK/Ycf46/Vps4 family AAA+-type ATPase
MNNTSFSNSSSNDYFTNFNNYQSFSNYGNYGSNSTILYNQVLTMTIIPLITTIFSTLFTSLITDIKKSIGYMINYYSIKCDKKKIIQYNLYKDNEINKDLIPIIWYINKTNSIREGDMISFDEIIDDKNKIDMLLCPIYKESNEMSDSSTNNNFVNSAYNNYHTDNYQDNDKNKKNKSGEYLFVEINDDKKIFYYGIKSNNLCLMSYTASIQEIGEYILEIKNQYTEYKSTINKNVIKEKKIYIELYSDLNRNSSSHDVKIINKKVIPLIWYLNNKKLITQGVLTKLSDESNETNESKTSNTFSLGMFGGSSINTNLEDLKELRNQSPYTMSNGFIKNKSDVIIMPFVEENKNNDISSNDDTDNSKKSFKNKSKSDSIDNSDKLIEIDKNIFCTFAFKKTKSDYYPYTSDTKEFIIIQSEKHSINELVNWLENIKLQYQNHIENTNKIQYLYTYTSGEPVNKFVKSLLDKTQTFEHLFFEKKNEILNDIKNFSNVEYYQKFGMKRKLGWLLVGPPGSGKSALVTAISNELGRSLKNIPISLVKTNSEFEKAYGDFTYNNESISLDEIVITFDEIDSAYESQKLIKNSEQEKSEKESKSDTQSNIPVPVIVINTDNKNDKESIPGRNIQNLNKDDKLNIGIVLSKLDGNENQEGSVIIATCNDISKLDPALYRNGRLKLIELKYAGQEEIKQMIEKYCEIVLESEQINKIRNDCLIQTLNIKHLIAKYLLEKNFSISSNDIDKIIQMINVL